VDIVLDDGDFARFDNATRIKIFDAVHAADHRGLALAAPRAVNTRASSELPVVIVSAITALDEWRLQLPRRTMLVGLDRDRDQVYIGAAFPPPPGRDEGDLIAPEPPPHPHSTAIYTDASCIDARARLGLPWARGAFALHAIGFDQRSNAALVSLVGDEPRPSPVRPQGSLPAYIRPGPFAASPLLDAETLAWASAPAGSVAGWEYPLFVAAPGPTLTVLVALRGERSLRGETYALHGQRHLAINLAAFVASPLAPADVCLYLVSGGELGGPCFLA
jgi:hypothetical protein